MDRVCVYVRFDVFTALFSFLHAIIVCLLFVVEKGKLRLIPEFTHSFIRIQFMYQSTR